MMKMLNNMRPASQSSVKNMRLDMGAFRNVLTENTVIFNKAFQNQLIIPNFQDFSDNISEIYEKVRRIIKYYNCILLAAIYIYIYIYIYGTLLFLFSAG